MQTKYLIGFFVLLTVAGMGAVMSFGLTPRAVAKINFSQFATPTVAANSIVLSMGQELAEHRIVFIGLDPSVPFHVQTVQEFVGFAQGLQFKFDAVLLDDSLAGLPLADGLSVEHFNLKNDPARFKQGLKTVLDKGLHLLVIVPVPEASHKISGSLISLSQAQLTQELGKPVGLMGLVFAPFPRRRELEQNSSLPCNTGEEDRGGVASLGCMILQTSRGLYHKHAKAGEWVGLLQEVGTDDYLFLLSVEPAANP